VDTHHALDGVTAETRTAIADEQRIRRCPRPFDERVPKHLDAILPDRGGPFLAALAHASDVSAGAEFDVAAV
jgi:hypothetical protein